MWPEVRRNRLTLNIVIKGFEKQNDFDSLSIRFGMLMSKSKVFIKGWSQRPLNSNLQFIHQRLSYNFKQEKGNGKVT